MPSAIQGSLTLTAGDLAAGYRDLRGRGFQTWYSLFCLLLMAGFLSMMPGSPHWLTLLLLAVPIGVVWHRLSPKTLAKKHYARMKAEDLQLEFEFTDQDYRIQTAGSNFRQAYSSVHSYLEGKDTFALFTPGQVAQLVPKRAFSEEGIRQIGEWLKAFVPPRATKSPLGDPKRLLLLWALLIVAFVSIWYFLAPA